MLVRQDLRGRHQRRIEPAFQRHQRRARRHRGFARAHVALQQSPHGMHPAHVRADLPQYFRLRAGKLKIQFGEEWLYQMIIAGTRQRLRDQFKFFASPLYLHLQGDEFIQRQPLPRDECVRHLFRKMDHSHRIRPCWINFQVGRGRRLGNL